MFENIDHLCFDKDGVLIDVHSYWIHITKLRANYLKKEFHLNSSQQDILLDKMGVNLKTGKIKNFGPVGYKPRKVIINSVLDSLKMFSIKKNYFYVEKLFLDIDFYQQKSGDYKINLLDGVNNFFKKNSQKFKMSIFTSDRKKNAFYTLKKLKIDKYFSEVIGGDSVTNPKPHPEGILKACKSTNSDPQNTAYISDTYSDLIMAENANLSIKIGMLSGLGTKKQLELKSDLVCEDFNELSKKINDGFV